MIHALKYDARRSLARHLAAEMKASAVELIARADCVTPVPLHWWRRHRRGFNQARELARHLDLPLIDALIRTRHTRAQVELAAPHRWTNVQGAFGVRHVYRSRRSIQGLTIVLVDDVSTTGATLEECAKVLKEAGAAAVYAITAARVATRRPAQNESRIPRESERPSQREGGTLGAGSGISMRSADPQSRSRP
jgi:ComF family protein